MRRSTQRWLRACCAACPTRPARSPSCGACCGPAAELRFHEHVAARGRGLAALQRVLDATVWPRMNGGCRLTRDTEAAILAAGFELQRRERFSFRPTLFAAPVAPRILGSAWR